MAARTAYVGTESAGDVLTAANFNKLPGGLIGYAIVTSAQTGVSTITDVTSATIAVTVNSSRKIRVEAKAVLQQAGGAGDYSLYIREGATTLDQASGSATANGQVGTMRPLYIGSVSSGAHTYKLSMSTSANTIGTIAGATEAVYILVFDDGPAF